MLEKLGGNTFKVSCSAGINPEQQVKMRVTPDGELGHCGEAEQVGSRRISELAVSKQPAEDIHCPEAKSLFGHVLLVGGMEIQRDPMRVLLLQQHLAQCALDAESMGLC